MDVIRFRELAFALALCCANPAAAMAQSVQPTATEVIRSLGIDQMFAKFGQSIQGGPRQSGLTDERFLALWERAIPEGFGREALVADLDRDVAAGLDASELQVVTDFTTSLLGRRILELEAKSSGTSEATQIAAIARGQALLLQMPVRRRAMLGEVVELSGARTTVAMLHELLRAVALAVRVQNRAGVMIGYDEVEFEIGGRLASLDESLRTAMLGALAAAYLEMTDTELAAYIEILRQPAMRKFQMIVTESACRIIRRTMLEAVKDVVAHSHAVNV